MRSPSTRETGFGLVQALGDLNCPALELGRSSEAKLGDPVTVAAGAGTKPVRAMVVGKQEFAGYWEYFLDEAIFTSPAHPFWGGAGAIDANGRLIGIGSLHVEQLSEKARPARHQHDRADRPSAADPRRSSGLRPGQQAGAARGSAFFRPKMAMRSSSPASPNSGPAAEAGIRRGDVLASVGGSEIEGLGDFYRKVWSRGPAGVEIPIEIVRDGRAIGLRMRSADRSSLHEAPAPAVSADAGLVGSWTRVGDLVDELAHHRVAKGPEIVDRHHERAGAADHVVAVILGEAARAGWCAWRDSRPSPPPSC